MARAVNAAAASGAQTPSIVTNQQSEVSDADRKPSGVLPVLPSTDVVASLAYYTETLEFTEIFRQPGEGGAIVNGHVAFAGGQVMFNLNPKDAPNAGGGVYLWFRLFDGDIDALYARYKDKGVTVVEEIADQFWGDRSFTIKDNAGYHLAFNKAIPKK